MAARTWGAGSAAGADGKWSTAANWTGDTVPATTDAITLDATTANNLTIDALGTWSGGTLTWNGFAGTVTQNVNMTTAAFSIQVGTSSWTQAANLTTTTFSLTGTNNIAGSPVTNYLVSGSRTFQCTTFLLQSGRLDFSTLSSCLCTGLVTINSTVGVTPAANCIAPSGTWECRGGWSQSGTGADSIEFIASGGTINLTSNSAQTINVPSIQTFNLVTINKTGGNVVISNGSLVPLGASPTTTNSVSNSLTVTGTVTVSGHWTHVGDLTISATTGTVSGALTDLTFGDDLTINATATFPTGVKLHVVDGGSLSTITATATTFGTSTILKTTSGGCTIANGTTVPLGANPTTTSISFAITVTGTLTASGTWSHTGSITVSATTGVVSGALTAVNVSGNVTGSFTVASTGTFPSGVVLTFTDDAATTLDAPTVTFGQVVFSKNFSTVAATTISAGTTVPLGTDPTVTLTNGALALNGNFSATGTISYTGGAVTLGAGTVVTGSFTWKHLSAVNFTVNAATTWASTGGIWFSVTAAGTRTFAGAGKTYASFRRSGSNGALVVITGTNTFGTFIDNDAQVAHSITFPNVTTTVGSFVVRGATGKLVTLQRTGGSGTFTLAKSTAGNVDEVGFISVSNSTVDASPIWYAGVTPPSVDGGGNTNWIFTAPPSAPKLRKAAVLV